MPTTSTTQSACTLGDGSTARTAPIGASGDNARATTAASRAPATTARSGSSDDAITSAVRSAPSALATASSLRNANTWRRMACAPISSAAAAAIAPNTARAMLSGRIARSTCPSTTDVRWNAYTDPGGRSEGEASSRSTTLTSA